ncbi:transcription factor bHLH144 [Macadamia integrifolia]|uniref:transcription factor bHLH144 n=1 Tax=Macadamia integrifolia TaxID=60698 RepID=UPI001C529A78|nr:transcription factor bHLH144 [Macadamia integrifolia]XP_042478873.1 transcription factor bHLH144 [Macadamia integrifolia]
MQSDQQIYQQKVVTPHAYQVGGSCMHNGSMAPPTLGITVPPPTKHSTPLHGVELQPLEVCPKNFIIFDQNDKRSRIMFHPALAHKFSCPGFDIEATDIENDEERENRDFSSTFKEDTEDIDALLSLEEEEQEDGDEVSTARTLGSCGSKSTDSCSNYGSKPSKRKMSSSVQKLYSGSNSSSSSSSNSSSERKRLRMKKMVKALRGIVPGGDEMNTVAVLDEAVRYLKSLKVEVEKLGIGDLKM